MYVRFILFPKKIIDMEQALQRRVQRYGWDKAALYYETFWQDQLRPAQDLLLEMAQLQPGEKVLDVACGTGLVSFRASDAVKSGGFVIGTDISDKMVEMASAIAGEKKYSAVAFSRMDGEELQFPDADFDVVLCSLGLMYMPDPLKALKEMHRVLKPGGRIVAAVWGRRDHCGWAEIFEIVDKRVASEVCPMFFNLGFPDRLSLFLETAGYTNISSQTISTNLHYASDEDACGAAFAGGPVALAYNKFSDLVKAEAHAEYLASMSEYKNNEGYDVPGEFVVAKGFK